MLETKEQKQTLAAAIVMILILGIISFTSHPNFLYKEPPPEINKNQQAIDAKKYLRYLESLKLDPKASQQLFEAIITQKEIQAQVENELQINQQISQPSIEGSKLVKSDLQGKKAVLDYLAKITGSVLNFNTQSKELNTQLFSNNVGGLEDLKNKQEKAFLEVISMPSPKDGAVLQETVAKVYASYGKLIDASLTYAKGENSAPWPEVYKTYIQINEQLVSINREVSKLAKQYEIADLPIQPVYVFGEDPSDFRLIKQARAFLGIGDVTITVGDIPRIIKEAVEEGLATSFASFMGDMLNKLIAKIESNYLIANFLYYTDALVAGQYTDDYLQKYVTDQLDRQIIKRFIPQFTCGASPSDLAPIFQAKAQEYLGFDVKSLRPSDTDYYQKLARIGDPLSFSVGWEQYYESVAVLAKTEAEKAAERELLSPGLKTPRDTMNSAIAISVNNIVSASRASLNAAMNLGIGTAKSFISGFVSQLTQNLINKYVFRGVALNNGALGVLKEQKTCLATAQLQPVLPIEITAYQAPPAPPSQEDLLEQECAKYPRGCTVLPTQIQPN